MAPARSPKSRRRTTTTPSYAEDNSVAKCRAFLTACRILLRRMPPAGAAGAEQMQLTPNPIQKEMAAAQDWLGSHDTRSTSTAGGRG